MAPASVVADEAPDHSDSCRSMESRTGRAKQRYNESGERLVAGVVPLTEDYSRVMLIQSTRRKGWVLPKGGWETDEECAEAATREAWEEAGIYISIVYDLGLIQDTRPPKDLSKEAPRALFRFFQATVTNMAADWPERHKRNREWFTYSAARELLASRPELLEALEKSTIDKFL